MIVLVALYTGYNVEGEVNLGASNKIKFVISILSQLSDEIILINTAHNSCESRSFIRRKIIINNVEVDEIILPTLESRPIGKLINLLHVSEALDKVFLHKTPDLIWCYNAYAFEMLFALRAYRRKKLPIILEFEDWHFSRNRGLSLKPYVDYLFWRMSRKIFRRVYAINSFVAQKSAKFCSDIVLFPGVVGKKLSEINIRRQPFSGDIINVGYFGNLKTEKGADIVLALVDRLPEKFQVHVTGNGILAESFASKAKSSDRLVFHGMVSDDELLKIIERCDVILNPHAPMDKFDNGLFPFKVVEAIASGRLLVSTSLPMSGFEEIASSIMFVPHTINGFVNALSESEIYFHNNRGLIVQSAQRAVDLFGSDTILNSLKGLFGK